MDFDYTPLFKTLHEKGMGRTDLRKVLDKATAAKFGNNQDMKLSTLAKVCIFLEVPIEKVVKINLDKK